MALTDTLSVRSQYLITVMVHYIQQVQRHSYSTYSLTSLVVFTQIFHTLQVSFIYNSHTEHRPYVSKHSVTLRLVTLKKYRIRRLQGRRGWAARGRLVRI